MALKQYIGARYVTKIYENSLDPLSAEWEADVNYEPLTMVTYNFGSYLSKKEVPATVGNPSDNPSYWTQTGFYNGQIAYLYDAVSELNSKTGNPANLKTADKSNLVNAINEVLYKGFLTPDMFGAVGDGVTDDSQAFQDMLDEDLGIIIIPNDKTYYLASRVTMSKSKTIIGSNSRIYAPNGFLHVDQYKILVLSGLEVSGDQDASPYAGTCFDGYYENCDISNLIVRYYNKAFDITQGSYFSVFRSSVIYQCTVGFECPAQFNNNTFINVSFTRCATALKMANDVREVLFIASDFEQCDVVIEAIGRDITFESCYFELNKRLLYLPHEGYYNSVINFNNNYILCSGTTDNGFLIYALTLQSVSLRHGCNVTFNGNYIDVRNMGSLKPVAFFGSYTLCYLVLNWTNNLYIVDTNDVLEKYVQLFDLSVASEYLTDNNRIPFVTDLPVDVQNGLTAIQLLNGAKIVGKSKIKLSLTGICPIGEQVSSKSVSMPAYMCVGYPTSLVFGALALYSDGTVSPCKVTWTYNNLTFNGLDNTKTCTSISLTIQN